MSKPYQTNTGHDSTRYSTGRGCPDTTPSPEPKQDNSSVSHPNAPTKSSNNSATDPTVPAYRPGFGCHKSTTQSTMAGWTTTRLQASPEH
jgi:hypothetical protein